MLSASTSFRSVVFGTALAAFVVGQAFASPINPLPPFPPGTGLHAALTSPINPLPPFPPGTGLRIE